MFKSSLKITLRNLHREKMYAVINISGLAIAIACCLILGLYLRDELTYDHHNTKRDKIFRVVNEFSMHDGVDSFAVTSVSLGPLLAKDDPEIETYVRFQPPRGDVLFRNDDKTYYWNDIYYADKNVFDVFSHEIIYGDPETALVDQTSIAVSESFARKYFGDKNPIGETIHSEDSTYRITLVFADLPENCHLRYSALISFAKVDLPEAVPRERVLFLVGIYTYLVVPDDYDTGAFSEVSDAFFEKHMSKMPQAENTTWRCWLQPLTYTHFQNEVGYDLPNSNRFYIYGFAAVAFFILMVACINYMNLATARATRRAKEVGMRKILGANRVRLVCQFLVESVFFSLISLLLGLVLVEVALSLTPLNSLLGKTLALNFNHGLDLFGWMLVFALGVGLLAGIYPALYLSAILPLPALVGGIQAGKGNIRLRQILVLIQFVITVGVIACTLLMALQMRYVAHKSLGFKKESRLIIPLQGADLIEKLPTIRKELQNRSDILGISTSQSLGFVGGDTGNNVLRVENSSGVMEETGLKWMQIGDDFLDVMGMEIAAGRDFSKKLLTDIGDTFIVNEAFVKKMGWSDPLGKRIDTGRVIGVVKDFHFASLHSPIEPFVLMRITLDTKNLPNNRRAEVKQFFILNISGEDIPGTLSFLENIFAEFDPKHPFTFTFVDDSLNKLYLSENRLMKLTGFFSAICIFISCLGLFGLAAFTTEKRTKEIGIRKVLGASTVQIIIMLSRGILLLVLGGAVIASFLSYYAMDEWLTGFAYHTDIDLWVFLLSAAVAAIVAFGTVALQSFKTAQSNPVNALRYE
jgi:putative ABC transport system permease protein